MRIPRKRIVPGMDSGVKLDKQSLKSLEKKSWEASIKYDDYVKARNKEYLAPKQGKYRIKESLKTTGSCILQAFIKAAKENCLHGKYLETSTALIAHYVDASRKTIRRHIKKLIDAGIIVEKQDKHQCTHNNNYLILLADWLIDELYEILEKANGTESVQEEVPVEKTQGIKPVQEPINHDIERVALKIAHYVKENEENKIQDTRESWQAYLKNRFWDSG